MQNLKKHLNTAKKAALGAGKILLDEKNNLKKELSSTNKDIKLLADIKAEEYIKNLILDTGIDILAEESSLEKKALPDIFWVVDPLDGTANYSRDIPLCCVSIALVANFVPVMGVIYDFNNDNLYEGSINTKARMNGQRIKVSNIKSPNRGILMTGLPNDTDYSNEAMLKMIKNFQDWRKVRMIGSAALAAIYVASGRAELYTENKSYLWDVAAGAAIVNAAGGQAIVKNRNENFQVDAFFSNSVIEINKIL